MLIIKQTLSYEYGTMMHTSILISIKEKVNCDSFVPTTRLCLIANKYTVFFFLLFITTTRYEYEIFYKPQSHIQYSGCGREHR